MPRRKVGYMRISVSLMAIVCFCFTSAFSDTLVLKSGNKLEGTILQTNGGEYVVLTDFAVYNFAQSSFKAVKKQPPTPAARQGDGRLPDFRDTLLSLGRQQWCSNLTQIPATVIDKGILRNVPYVSFRCGGDYEVNIYGDLKDPAGIEAGVYRTLLNDDEAKRGCLRFIADLLNESADREIPRSLNLEKDSKERDGYTFEITPPYAEDAYEGWWVSVYSEKKLDRSRASDKEMEQITVSKTAPLEADSSWTADEMKLARTPKPDTITIVNSSGQTVTNAEVVRVVDNAYLIWRSPTGGMGMTRLETLPEEIRTRLGYDANKAATAYAAEERRKSATRSQVAVQPVQVAPPQSYTYETPSSYSSSGTRSSGGGSVYVKGYYRKDGTYVQPHTRSSPRRR